MVSHRIHPTVPTGGKMLCRGGIYAPGYFGVLGLAAHVHPCQGRDASVLSVLVSHPPGQNQNNNDDKNDTDDSDPAVAKAVAIAACVTAEPAQKRDCQQDDEDCT